MSTTAELSYSKSASFSKLLGWLNPLYSKIRDLHFWIIQSFVITLTILHILTDNHLVFPNISCSDFFPATMFFIPVIYAALRFGFAGSFGIALEAAIINAPGTVLFHQGLAIFGLGIQFLFLIIGAVVLGQAIDQQRASKLRANTYATLLTNAHEKERQRIARDLHDGSIQTMIQLCRELDAVNNLSLPAAPREKLQAAKKIAEQQITALRNVTSDLRPPILDDLGIVDAIRRLQMDMMDRTGVNGEFEVSGDQRRLSSDLELSLFRIAQEALSNVERHSKATKVIVTIGFANKEISLKVHDDGIGFTQPVDPRRATTADGGLGILGMEERAELLEGKLEIQSSRGKGTLVSMVIPL